MTMAKRTIRFALGPALAAMLASAGVSGQSTPAKTFQTPEEAMQALAAVAGSGDTKKTEEMFGQKGLDLLKSGDEIADREDARRVKAAILEKVAFEDRGASQKVAVLGKDGWPFPIPLVLENGRWRFDVEAGREEITTRRIGRNELSTLATLHAYVEAQREFFSRKPAAGPPAYAQRLISTEGKHDGLCWKVAPGEPESPLGPLVAAAAREGYKRPEGEPTPFHGYFFRILTAQAKNAPGGAGSYLDEKGAMTKGFALVAWPAKYGSSGVMTFLVGRQGIVFQKDLGASTEAAVAGIAAYDPDETWTPTGD
ncbi:MAG: DUF2950 domain-containing protein [Thermoanaerobaculia bacterium]